MKMKIEREQLKELLEEKQNYIGWKGAGVDTFISGIALTATMLCSSFHKVLGISSFAITVFFGIITAIIVIYGAVKAVKGFKDSYSYKDLLGDIDKMDEVQKSFSLVAVRDTFNEHPGRFLVYHDSQWDCWFFPNVKTLEENNAEKVRAWLMNTIKVDDLEIHEEAQDIYTKKHPSGEDRTYHHTLYEAKVKEFPEQLKKNSFKIDGLSYRWMTINEMEQDANTMEKNRDVVHLVKDNIR